MKDLKISLKKISIIIVLFISICSLYACAQNGTAGVEYELIDNETYTISRDLGLFAKNVPNVFEISETYKNKPITVVGYFGCVHNVEKIIGSVNVERLKADSFACRSLTSVNLSKDMMHLKEVIFPQDGHLQKIGQYSFYQCLKLEKVVLPANFSGFERGCFYDCRELKQLIIYNEVPPQGLDIAFNSEAYTYNPPKNLVVYVPTNAIETYKAQWVSFKIKSIEEIQ